MKITDLYDENEKAHPFLIDADNLRKKIEFGICLIFIIFFISVGYWYHNLSLKDTAKQHFICNDSVCKFYII